MEGITDERMPHGPNQSEDFTPELYRGFSLERGFQLPSRALLSEGVASAAATASAARGDGAARTDVDGSNNPRSKMRV